MKSARPGRKNLSLGSSEVFYTFEAIIFLGGDHSICEKYHTKHVTYDNKQARLSPV